MRRTYRAIPTAARGALVAVLCLYAVALSAKSALDYLQGARNDQLLR